MLCAVFTSRSSTRGWNITCVTTRPFSRYSCLQSALRLPERSHSAPLSAGCPSSAGGSRPGSRHAHSTSGSHLQSRPWRHARAACSRCANSCDVAVAMLRPSGSSSRASLGSGHSLGRYIWSSPSCSGVAANTKWLWKYSLCECSYAYMTRPLCGMATAPQFMLSERSEQRYVPTCASPSLKICILRSGFCSRLVHLTPNSMKNSISSDPSGRTSRMSASNAIPPDCGGSWMPNPSGSVSIRQSAPPWAS
mmetsp:Transcript_28498/g.71576  ORF Transcript_28498/g.71576 Transcript_28498/m.71576 type:complete len:250 (+) Transcript_28498:401-1150(+)